MNQVVDPLILDLLDWIGTQPRPYRETVEAWRTSCPRLAVWEEASDRGLVERGFSQGHGATISVTAAGRALLARGGRRIAERERDAHRHS